MEIKIRLQPKQSRLWDLWDTQKNTRLGMGGARGGSKSGGGRRLMILRRFTYPNTTGLILRRTYPALYKSHLVKIFEEYPELKKFWRESSKELMLPNGSRLFFDSAQSEKELASYYSGEFADIMLDEAQEFSQNEIEKLSGSNRCTSNDDITCAMLFTFMPGLSEEGVPPLGLDYLKRVFVENKLREKESQHKWAFVQAFAWDNIEWARKELRQDGIGEEEFYSWPSDQRRDYFITRTEFGHQLSGLTNDYLRDAWLYGKWDVFQGQYFQNFRYERDTLPDDEVKIEPWHKRWISGDWGYDHPACFHWHAQDEDGQVVTYREFWSIGLGEAELGRKISELSAGEDLKFFYLSWDAFGKLNKSTRKPITQMIAENLAQNVPDPIPADSSPGTRISGWRLMHQLFDARQWKIARSCTKLIECLPTLVRDMQRNSEDVLKVDHSENYIGDDPADSARYGLAECVTVAQRPLGLRVHERFEQIKKDEPEVTMTHLMMARENILKEEQGKTPQAVPIRRRFNQRWNKYS